MDWHKEAMAVIEDMQPYVTNITICQRHRSSELGIYFYIMTLEQEKLVVLMDSNGFSLCDKRSGQPLRHDPPTPPSYAKLRAQGIKSPPSPVDPSTLPLKTYETMNALLDDNSRKYRKKFAGALMDKIDRILSDQP